MCQPSDQREHWLWCPQRMVPVETLRVCSSDISEAQSTPSWPAFKSLELQRAKNFSSSKIWLEDVEDSNDSMATVLDLTVCTLRLTAPFFSNWVATVVTSINVICNHSKTCENNLLCTFCTNSNKQWKQFHGSMRSQLSPTYLYLVVTWMSLIIHTI